MGISLTPAVDIVALHTAIKTALTAKFPTFTVDMYVRQGDKIKAPAIFFELDSCEPGAPQDVGTEQFQGNLRFSAYVIVAYNQPSAQNVHPKLAVKLLALSLVSFIRGQRWGGQQGSLMAASIVGTVHDDFNQPNESYEVMRVDWEHEALIGTSVFDSNDLTPTEVFIGFSPFIGPANIDKYIQIAP